MTLSIDERIYKIAKASLRSGSGMAYADFKRGLIPQYSVVWRDIALGYLALAGLIFLLVFAQDVSLWVGAMAVPIAGLLFGFAFAYLNLFFHEAAHWNLAASKRWNDFLANWCIGLFFGQLIAAYRVVHFGHHQHHGTPLDSEHSYFDPLNMRFIAGGLLGVRALQVSRKRQRTVASAADVVPLSAARNAVLRGMLLNGMIVLGALSAGYWTISLAWTLGLLSFFPFLNALRQLLEHRHEFAANDRSYHEIPHGRVNRLFGDSILAQTLGGAGFNRHLLHHWEPQVSYTRLKELEDFVMDCDCAGLFKQRQTTYARALFHFLRQGRHEH